MCIKITETHLVDQDDPSVRQKMIRANRRQEALQSALRRDLVDVDRVTWTALTSVVSRD